MPNVMDIAALVSRISFRQLIPVLSSFGDALSREGASECPS